MKDELNDFESPFMDEKTYKKRISDLRIDARLVKAMLGGKWPKDKYEFGWDAVDYFKVDEDGWLIPSDGFDDEAPGPDLRLEFKVEEFM